MGEKVGGTHGQYNGFGLAHVVLFTPYGEFAGGGVACFHVVLCFKLFFNYDAKVQRNLHIWGITFVSIQAGEFDFSLNWECVAINFLNVVFSAFD